MVVDIALDNALEAFSYSKEDRETVITDDPDEAEKAIAEGKRVATTDYKTAVRLSRIQSVIDATGSSEMSARITLDCIRFKKHIVMMNVECDVTVGPILYSLCKQAGIVYSLTAGDEPGSIVEVWRFAKALDFEVGYALT